MVLNINGLTLSLGEGVDLLPAWAAALLGLSEGVATDLRVLRCSMDARRTRPPRFVYSFCMCPGGQVIGCSAQKGGVITNGMSRFRRDSPYANSAVVVNVRVDDLGGESPLAGLAFRRHWEERAFLAGGIISSALDGIRAAERLIDSLGN